MFIAQNNVAYESRVDEKPVLKLNQRHATQLVRRLKICGLTREIVVPTVGSVVPALQQGLCDLLADSQLVVESAPKSSREPGARLEDAWWEPWAPGKNMSGLRILNNSIQVVHNAFTVDFIKSKVALFQCEELSRKLIFVGTTLIFVWYLLCYSCFLQVPGTGESMVPSGG